MNQPDDSQRDELRERLLEQALRETLGGESPPDLSDRILAAADEQTSELPQPVGEGVMEKSKKGFRFSIASVVTVCSVALVFGGLLFLSQVRVRNAARQENRTVLQANVMTEPSPPSEPSSGYGADAEVKVWDLEGAPDACAMPQVSGPVTTNPTKQWLPPDDPSFRQPLMQGGGVQYNRIAGPGSIPAAPSGGPFESFLPLKPNEQETGTTRFEFSAGVRSDAGLVGPVVVDEGRFDAQRPGYVAQQNTARSLPFSPDGRTLATSSSDGLRMMVEPRVIIQTEDEERLGLVRDQVTAEQLTDTMEVQRKFKLNQGQGPGRGGDRYVRVVENPFRAVKDHPLSTFSIDVDTASYANVRRFLLQENRLPPPDAVRIEELVNYFDYDYSGPTGDVPFASHIEVAGCPWAPEHRLVRIALKGYEIDTNQRPKSNLVFLLDVSGSMNSSDKLPLLQQGMKLLAGQLGENDRVAIVVYAGSEGLVLPSTVGDQRAVVLDAIDRLKSGGSTNGGAGIELAYKIALENFIKDGVNRVILCTDGDFNVGTTSTGDLERMVEEKAKSGVFLSVLGFGRGNLNDAMMETISNKGNGNYAYIDGITEAQKVLVEQMGGTLVTIAKDVKIQVEFNPTQVEAYRLIGYENRMLAAEDFNDDRKDAGEIGAGHTVTALYELVPAGGKVELPDVDPLRYQVAPSENQDESVADELLTLKLRYKEPDGDTSELLEFPTTDGEASFSKASPDFQFAAAVASFGMLLRGSAHSGMSTYDAVLEIAESAKGADKHGYRAEFVEMAKRAREIVGPVPSPTPQDRSEAKPDGADTAVPPKGLVGIVLAVKDSLIEISLGSDDGVQKGHRLDVLRDSTRLGKIEVIAIKPDKAVCKVLLDFRKGVIEVSDRVVARGG